MPKDIEIPVIHRAQDALRLRLAVKPEPRMDRADRIIELFKQVVGIIQRAVCKDVDLARFQDAKAP
jgi:hypothetical protein